MLRNNLRILNNCYNKKVLQIFFLKLLRQDKSEKGFLQRNLKGFKGFYILHNERKPVATPNLGKKSG